MSICPCRAVVIRDLQLVENQIVFHINGDISKCGILLSSLGSGVDSAYALSLALIVTSPYTSISVGLISDHQSRIYESDQFCIDRVGIDLQIHCLDTPC